MAEGSTRLKSIDGVLYDNKVTDLKAYPTHRHAETFILPETVTKMSDKFQGIQYLKTFIGDYAFYGNVSLQKVTLPETVTSLGNGAFYQCSSLTSVNIPSLVKEILPSTFYYCRSLTSMVIPQSITAIGEKAFYGCSRLASVTLPSTLKSIESGVFNSSGLKSVVIPDSVKSIGSEAFYYCYNLNDVTIGASVDSIASMAFSSCAEDLSVYMFPAMPPKIDVQSSYYASFADSTVMYVKAESMQAYLNSITLPNSVDSIGNHVFSGCSALKNIKFSENLRILNRNAFQATAVEELNLPQSLTFIGSSAFSGCDKLTKVNIPENVTTIDDGAFCMDSLITQIFIPRYIYKLGNWAFERCRSIKVATVAYTYEVPGTGPLTPLDETRVPSRTRIGYEVFMNCTALEKIFFGPTVKSLGSNFLACTPNLKKIFLANPVPPDMYADEQAFDSYTATLYVPKASIETYRTNRYWGKFKNIKAIEGCTNDVDEFFTDTQPGDEIIVSDGAIDFANPDAEVTVFNLSGKVIYSGKAARLSVAPAVYIVSVNSRPVKVIVR